MPAPWGIDSDVLAEQARRRRLLREAKDATDPERQRRAWEELWRLFGVRLPLIQDGWTPPPRVARAGPGSRGDILVYALHPEPENPPDD